MEIEAWVKQKKELYAAIMGFIESESDSGNEFRTLTKVIKDQEIIKNEKSTLELFQTLYKIGDNHQRTNDFFNRLSQIFEYLAKERFPIKISEIFEIYKRNKRLLLLIFEQRVINQEEFNAENLFEIDNTNDQQLKYYLFSEIKNFLDEETKKKIENEIAQLFNEDVELFEAKCKKGENDSLICQLIRQDSIKEFVSYVSRTNLSLMSTIKPDFYESNSFLIENEPSLIEYAFFYGSIQVIKYMQIKHIEFSQDICQYAIHSNNSEMIEFVEKNEIQINTKSVIESIKCHHNDITNYIIDKLIGQTQNNKFYDDISRAVIEYCNYYYCPDDIISIISNPEKFKMCYLALSFNYITIPSSVTLIGNNAFEGCSSLTQISIPSSVTSIGSNAFHICSSLTQISIPSSIASIGDSAFYGCLLLKQISIPSSVSEIGDCVFGGCSSLKQISISSSITSIGNYTFLNCTSLTQISIPSSITKIGNHVFNGCSSLKQITFPSSVTEIGESAFYECSSLTQITIPSSITSIGDNAFFRCSLLKQILFQLPSSLTSIGEYAFYGCSSLTQISIPSSLTSIGEYAFYGCSSLTQISIPSFVTSIEKHTFHYCSKLTQISFEMPSSLTSIGENSFTKCSSISEIIIPSSVTSIGNYAFKRCSSLTQISIPSGINTQNLGIGSGVKINII